MDVLLTPDAMEELGTLERRERLAMDHAVQKLRESEYPLGFPHVSRIRGARRVWELRPRAGRSRSRAVFRIIQGTVVVAAVGPEAAVDVEWFRRAVKTAETRLDLVEEAARER